MWPVQAVRRELQVLCDLDRTENTPCKYRFSQKQGMCHDHKVIQALPHVASSSKECQRQENQKRQRRRVYGEGISGHMY
jgi:hypothetical protein